MSDQIDVHKLTALEDRVGEIENSLIKTNEILGAINVKMSRIEVGLFGDGQMNYVGVIEAQKLLTKRIIELESEIADIKKVNNEQEISIHAKKTFTDDFVMWSKRIFWICITLGAVTLLLTGKIGIFDLVKLVK